jgi:TetR/AcrR family fatty acid metabolism transcriptional regulator
MERHLVLSSVTRENRFFSNVRRAGAVKKKANKRQPSQDRRERILEVARALFEEKGYQGATTAQIAAAAGVPEGTLFEDFHTKRDLVFAVLERDIEVYLDFLEIQLRGIEGALNRIRKFIWSHLYTWRRRRFIARFLILEVRQDPGFYQSHAHDLMQRYDEDLMGLIREGIEEGSIRADINTEMVRNVIFGGIEQMALHWALKEEPFDVDASTKELCGLVFRAIQA